MKSLSPLRSLGRSLPRLLRRVFLLLCCWYAAFTGQAPAALVAANQPAVWPDHEPYGTVGGRYGNGYTAKLPMPLIAVLRPLLGEEPSQWNVLRMRDYSGRSQRLLEISVTRKGVDLLATRGSWVNLCAPAGVPFLNQVLERLPPAALQDRERVESYLAHIINLHSYGLFSILTPELQRERFTTQRKIDLMNLSARERRKMLANDPELKQPQIDIWLEGTEKSRQALLALFHDVELSRSGDHVTARCNVMSYHGNVEQWTFRLRVGRTVQLEAIDVVELRPEGTFSYPLIL